MKKITTLLLAILLFFGTLSTLPSTVEAATFKDVTTGKAEIEYLASKGIIGGIGNEKFGPNQNLTRAQAVAMIIREKKVNDFSSIPNPNFKDVPTSHPMYQNIAAAVHLGIVSGYNEKGVKLFKPNNTITRAEMASIMSMAYGLSADYSVDFRDVKKGHWAERSIDSLFFNNITVGYPGHIFKPNEPISRLHFSLFLARHLNPDFKGSGTPVKPDIKEMKVHFIDVGQGDATLIQSPDGANILIDAGTKSAGQKVVSFLKSKDVGKLDLVIATHPHEDHIGGMATVLNSFKVDRFVDSGRAHTTQTYYNMLQIIDNKNIPFELAAVNKAFYFDNGLKIRVVDVDKNAKNINDASVSVKAIFKNHSALLTGDAEAAAESRMTARGGLKSTVFKAGHHGSNTSNGVSFLNQVKPQHTVLSYGANNSYKHPHSQVVTRLKNVGSKVYSTAQSGDITFRLDGNIVLVSATPFTGSGHAVAEPKPTPKPQPSKPAPKPSKPAPPKGNPGDGTYVIPGAPTSFKNCTEMRKYYPNGVKKGHPAYASKHDRDKDGWACER